MMSRVKISWFSRARSNWTLVTGLSHSSSCTISGVSATLSTVSTVLVAAHIARDGCRSFWYWATKKSALSSRPFFQHTQDTSECCKQTNLKQETHNNTRKAAWAFKGVVVINAFAARRNCDSFFKANGSAPAQLVWIFLMVLSLSGRASTQILANHLGEWLNYRART